VRRLAEEGEKGGEGGEALDLPESHMDKAMAWNPELMEAEDEEEVRSTIMTVGRVDSNQEGCSNQAGWVEVTESR
jgi:hypothetical protein